MILINHPRGRRIVSMFCLYLLLIPMKCSYHFLIWCVLIIQWWTQREIESSRPGPWGSPLFIRCVCEQRCLTHKTSDGTVCVWGVGVYPARYVDRTPVQHYLSRSGSLWFSRWDTVHSICTFSHFSLLGPLKPALLPCSSSSTWFSLYYALKVSSKLGSLFH